MLIVSDVKCAAASVYTQNLVKGAPISVTEKNLKDGCAQAIICNSGNANTCNAGGVEVAEQMCALVEQYAAVAANDVIIASTGVIGQPLDLTPIKNKMGELAEGLAYDKSREANLAIMTTDLTEKECAVSFLVHGKKCRLGGIAKGSGMINPNMATMLAFVTTDCAITPALLKLAVSEVTKVSFNMVSVDGDTSTNDMFSVLANGTAGNNLIDKKDHDFDIFVEALKKVAVVLSKKMAADGEGATKLLECKAWGAKDFETAAKVAKGVISSSLFKAAMFGADANWGRVLCAIGYSGADVDINKIDVVFSSAAGKIEVCKNGMGLPFDEAAAKKILSEKEIQIYISLNSGDKSATAWGCDLTYDYVKINGDYRS